MTLDWRNLILGLIGLGMIGFVVVPPALYSIGNWTAPESPVPVPAPLPPLHPHALSARHLHEERSERRGVNLVTDAIGRHARE